MGIAGWTLGALIGTLGPSGAAATVEPTAIDERPATSGPADPERTRKAKPERPVPGANAMVLSTHAKIPDWALALTYQRALGRRFSIGAGLEYGFQPRGYWHLQGVGETLSGQVWFGRTFQGMFAEASLTVAHQFLAKQPRLSMTALVPGVGLGYRWTHRSGLTLGGSGGLRWGAVVDPSSIICTRPKYCTSVRKGAYARITVDVGFVF